MATSCINMRNCRRVRLRHRRRLDRSMALIRPIANRPVAKFFGGGSTRSCPVWLMDGRGRHVSTKVYAKKPLAFSTDLALKTGELSKRFASFYQSKKCPKPNACLRTNLRTRQPLPRAWSALFQTRRNSQNNQPFLVCYYFTKANRKHVQDHKLCSLKCWQ